MKLKVIYIIVFAASVLTGFFACIDDPKFGSDVHNAEAPVLSDFAIVERATTASSVVLKGTVLKANGYPVTECGFMWDTDIQFENGTKNRLPLGGGIGEFEDTVKFLSANTTYYFRMYAINEKGVTGYSDVVSEITGDGKGRVRTFVPNDYEHATTAVVGGTVIIPGEGETALRGVYYSKSKTLDNKKAITSNTPLEVDSFVCNLTGLDAETSYYVLAFMTNTVSGESITSYGDTLVFMTGDGKPRVDSVDIYSTGYTDITVISRTLSKGDAPLKERGFCWGTSSEPTKADNYIACGNQEGSFAEDITGLLPKQPYYVRAYAENIFGIHYGKEVLFYTKSDVPIINTSPISSIDYQTGTISVGGELIDKGKSNITKKGICYSSTLQKPTIVSCPYEESTAPGNIFTVDISGLKGGTKYYVCAFAINNEGASYGEVLEITTPDILSLEYDNFGGSERFTASSAYFMIGSKGYLLGGDKGPAYTDELWSFNANASKDNWQQLYPHPKGPAKWQAVAVHESKSSAFVLGGLGYGNVLLDDFYQYNAFSNLWNPLPTGPDAAYLRVGFPLEYALYYVGGKGLSVKDEVWQYNYNTETWSTMPAFPVKQYGGVALTVNDEASVYVGMGKDESDLCNKTLWRSDDASSWTQETVYSSINGGVIAGAVYKSKIYLIDESFYIHEYDIEAKTWKRKSRITAGGQDVHCMYVVNGLIHIGLIDSKVYIYNPVWDN